MPRDHSRLRRMMTLAHRSEQPKPYLLHQKIEPSIPLDRAVLCRLSKPSSRACPPTLEPGESTELIQDHVASPKESSRFMASFKTGSNREYLPTPKGNRMNKWIPLTGWILALGLGITCLILIFEIQERMFMESVLRADPGQLNQHRARSEAGLARPLILLTGDSRARDLGTAKIGRYHVENRGIPGQTTAEVLARVGRDMAILRPNQVVVIAGINDLKAGSSGGGPSQAASALEEIVAIGEAMKIPVTVIETWGPSEGTYLRGMALPANLPEAIATLNSRLSKINSSKSARTAPADVILNDNDLVRAEFARDSLHLNERGLDILRKLIHESLDAENTDTY